MKTIIIYFCSIFLSVQILFSQPNLGARVNGSANISSPFFEEPFGLVSNPSFLTYNKELNIGSFYSPSPFGLEELKVIALSVSYDFQLFQSGILFYTYGFELYKENRFTFSIARKFFEQVSIGINLNYNTLNIKNYGSKTIISFDIGITFELYSNFVFSSSFTNINSSTWKNKEDKLPQIFRNGLSFNGVRDLIISIELEKDFNHNFDFKFAGEYSVIEQFFIRTGYRLELGEFSAGFGLNWKGLSFDYAMSTHLELGLTHSFGLNFSLR